MLLLLCRLVNRRTWKKNKCILLNNEQENKVNSQRSFSCISVDFSGESQQALFSLPPDSIHSFAAVKLGSEETEQKSIHVSIWPLIFSLTTFLFSTPSSHHLSFFLVPAIPDGPQWPIHPHALHKPGQDVQYPMDSHNSWAGCNKVTAPITYLFLCSIFPLLHFPSNVRFLSLLTFWLSLVTANLTNDEVWFVYFINILIKTFFWTSFNIYVKPCVGALRCTNLEILNHNKDFQKM